MLLFKGGKRTESTTKHLLDGHDLRLKITKLRVDLAHQSEESSIMKDGCSTSTSSRNYH